jgi:gamma-glutamylcyclotransferase (GGCT)/AIG2-like uncharacterized protein YtfP
MAQAIERLFVYGSLKPGQANAHVLEAIGGAWQAACVTGTLHAQGWGAALGYPALVLDDNGAQVHGLVFTSENLQQHWQSLDEFEGSEYERVLATTQVDDGSTIQAWVYVARQ